MFKATNDPTHRAILSRLAQQGPLRVTQTADHFEMSLNSVPIHIKVLEQKGLVSRRVEWRDNYEGGWTAILSKRNEVLG